MTIPPNSRNIIARIFMTCMWVTLLFLVSKLFIKGDNSSNDLLYFLCATLGFLLIYTNLSLFGIVKIETDEAGDQITFIRLISRKTISRSDITAYYVSVYNSRGGTTYGRIIKTIDKKTIELNPGNLLYVSDIDAILEKNGIKSLGEKSSFYPFTAGL